MCDQTQQKPALSRSPLKRRAFQATVALLALAFAWIFWPRWADLRGFDPANAARLETPMWRSYYEKRRVAATIYATTPERVLEAARIRSEMMDERDRRRDTVMTAADWQRLEDGLKRS